MATSITALGQLVGHPVVTDADADTLTAGASSNADSLHTHNGKANVSHSHSRSNLTAEGLVRYQVPLMTCRKITGDVMSSVQNPDGAFGIITGGWGSGGVYLRGEQANDEIKTGRVCFEFVLPPEYIADENVKLVVHARYTGPGEIGDTKTLDAKVYKIADEGTTCGWRLATSRCSWTSRVDHQGYHAVRQSDRAPGSPPYGGPAR